MSKKEIAVILLALVFIIGASVGGFFAWDHYQKWQKSKDAAQLANATPAGDGISLNSDSTTSNDTGGLKVDNGTTVNSAQLGSGQSKSISSGSAAQIDPTTFAQYEKYKSDQGALFADINVGSGAEVKDGSKVEVTYKGWLTNGTLFDESPTDSDGKTQSFVFTIGAKQVIPGFEQDMTGMKVGGSRLFIIPPAVGYGATAQKNIPANSVLVFQIKLINAL